jgi:hypothetical protein
VTELQTTFNTFEDLLRQREDGKETKNLSLGKDFDVSYKNNTNVGTAEVIIHGKGAYKGQFTVTFNIAR